MPFVGFPVFLLTLFGQPVRAVRFLSQTSAPLQGLRSKNRRQGSENPTYRLAPKAEQGSKAALMSVPYSSAYMPESVRAAYVSRRNRTARWRSPYSTRSPLTAFLRSQRTALKGRLARPHKAIPLISPASAHPRTSRVCFTPGTLLSFHLQGLDPPGDRNTSPRPILPCR
jgi:hypothetical protein